MKTSEQNYLLLQEIDANRRFLLMAYQQNPKLLKNAEARIKQIFNEPVRHDHSITLSPPPGEREAKPFSPRGKGWEGGKQRGISLVELVMFIVIISTAVVGILQVMNLVTAHSADPLIRKQALAIAESLLEEIELQDFSNPTGGFTPAIPGSPTRFERTNFDDITDYHGFATTGIYSANDPSSVISGLGNYNVAVAVELTTAPTALGTIPLASAAIITVTVTDPTGQTIDATGYRTAY